MKKTAKRAKNDVKSYGALACILLAILFFLALMWSVVCVVRFLVGVSLGA